LLQRFWCPALATSGIVDGVKVEEKPVIVKKIALDFYVTFLLLQRY
jgi:hypothetical protein